MYQTPRGDQQLRGADSTGETEAGLLQHGGRQHCPEIPEVTEENPPAGLPAGGFIYNKRPETC